MVPGEIVFGHLPRNGKGSSSNHLDKKLCCKQAATAAEFPMCRNKADGETEGHTCPMDAPASPELRDVLCQNPCAGLRFWVGAMGQGW